MKKLIAATAAALMLFGCGPAGETEPAPPAGDAVVSENEQTAALEYQGSMPLKYAEEFSVDYYSGGYKLLSLGDGSRFLLIPEGEGLPEATPADVMPLYCPVENIYLTATSAMGLFDSLGRLDAIRLSGTAADGWYIENAARAMDEGRILYAGKYSEPDYELILDERCKLTVQSTMIARASDVMGKLEELGIPVLIDQSSHEKHPLGRAEWIKLYAALLGEEQKAQELFARQEEYMERAARAGDTQKKVAFFHINSAGQAVVRKSGDYISRMIELAGGEYIFKDVGDPEDTGATETIELERFFAAAREADCLIYNGAIVEGVESIEELIAQNALLAELRAVKEGNVWKTSRSMFQDTMQHGRMISELHAVLSGDLEESGGLDYLHRLK